MFLVSSEPYELLCSPVCRTRVRYPIPSKVLIRGLGVASLRSLFSVFPSGLKHLAASVPVSHPWHDRPLKILREHTLFGYYTHYHQPERISDLEVRATSERALSIGWSLQTMYRCYAAKTHPRFCLDCVIEDEVKWGFSYFHCEHQLPGVGLCWIHATPLLIGCRRCGPAPLARETLYIPRRCRCIYRHPLLAFESLPVKREVLLWIAQQSEYLLKSPARALRPDMFLAFAIRKGYRTRNKADYAGLAEALERRYGTEVLEWLGYPVAKNGRRSSWWIDFFKPSSAITKNKTIEILLMVGLFCESAGTFDYAPDEDVNVLLRRISSGVHISRDPAPVEASRQACVLRELLETKSPEQVARDLETTLKQVISQAHRQGLIVPISSELRSRLGARKIKQIKLALSRGVSYKQIGSDNHVSGPAITQILISEEALENARAADLAEKRVLRLLNSHWEKLRSFAKRHNPISRNQVMKALRSTYAFLSRHDRARFQAFFCSPPIQRGPGGVQVNWRRRDRDFSKRIAEAAKELRNGPGAVRRISKERLLLTAGIKVTFGNSQAKLPKTAATLKRWAESQEQFYKRTSRIK